MRIFSFTHAEHEDHGEYGWQPDWIPGGEPLVGVTVAHDVIEHWADQSGSWDDEMLALGASLFVRGESGWYADKGHSKHNDSWAANIPSDIVQGLSMVAHQGVQWITGLANPSGTRRLSDPHLEEPVEQAWANLRRQAKDELGDECPMWALDERHERRTKALWRLGYRRARDRYRRPYEVAWLFDQIADQSDRYLTCVEPGIGAKLEIRLEAKTLKHSVRLIDPVFGDD